MKNKWLIIMCLLLFCLILAGCTNDEKVVSNEYKGESKVEGSFQIRFKDLVELKTLEKYDGKTVTAVGYLSPIMGYDNSFGYLMNLPYQTCPYCIPDDTRITNTIAIFAPSGKKIEATEAAVVVTGTLKLGEYTDDYGYEYSYRIVDATLKKADTESVGNKVALYNDVADKKILSTLLENLYILDDDVFCKEYKMQGLNIKIQKVDVSVFDSVIKSIDELGSEDLSILKKTAEDAKKIGNEINKIIDSQDIEKLKDYQERMNECFDNINSWILEYEL